MNTNLDPITYLEEQLPHHFWMATKGRLTESEPLYAIALFSYADSDTPLVVAEGKTLLSCAVAVAADQKGGVPVDGVRVIHPNVGEWA